MAEDGINDACRVIAQRRPKSRRRNELLRIRMGRPRAGIVVVEVAGEIDLLTVPGLSLAVHRQLASRPLVLVLDLDDVGFFGISGLALLIATRDRLAGTGAVLRLARLSPATARVLKALRLNGAFEIWEDISGAVEAPLSTPKKTSIDESLSAAKPPDSH
jgi:anti-sigma B factor antagonist